MAYSLEDAQEEIIAYLDSQFVQPIVEQSVPDIETVERDKQGQIKPYIAVSFADIREGLARSVVGPKGHDYVMTIRCQAIASTPKVARQLGNKLVRIMLGYSPAWSGGVTKSPAAGLFPITTSNFATEAYQMATGFSLTLQLQEY